MDLKAVFEPPKNGDCVLHRRRLHEDGLKPSRQGGIFFYVFPVFVRGGGADAVKFAPGKHGFEHVPGVDGPLGCPCPHNGVKFIDEEKYPSVALLHLVEDCLEAFLELSPEFRSRKEGTHIEGENCAVFESFGDVSRDNSGGEPLHDGGLSHSGVTDEHRVILGLPAQDTDGPADLLISSDDRVKLAGPGQCDEILAVFFEGFVGALRIFAPDARPAADLREGLEKFFLRNARFT